METTQHKLTRNRRNNENWKRRRYNYLYNLLLQLSNLQDIYDNCLEKAIQAGGGKTGVQFMVVELGLRKDDTIRIRRIIYELGINLDKRDLCYIQRSHNFWSMPQAKRETIISSRTQGLLDYWNNIDENERYERGNIISSRRQASEEEMMCKDKNRIINKSKASRTSGSKFRYYTTIDGKEILFHSKWEQSMYELLTHLGISFNFSNDVSRGTLLYLPGRSWQPDFIIENKTDIIEVKGYPLAFNMFYNDIVPSFKSSIYSYRYNVWLCKHNVSCLNITNYDQLLDYCELIHVKNCLR